MAREKKQLEYIIENLEKEILKLEEEQSKNKHTACGSRLL